MSEMVERVARAIYETDPVGVRGWADAPVSNREDCLVCARAAVEAMREPTEVVVNAAPNLRDVDFYPTDVWRAMIDAALKG